MRRYKQQLSYDESIDILRNQSRGVLAVLGDDEYPYTIPMNYYYHEDNVYFHAASEGHKIDAINNHEKVSFCVMDSGVKNSGEWWYTFNSIIIFGKLSIENDENKKLEILKGFGEKYFPSDDITQDEIDKFFDVTTILKLNIEHITGKIVKEK